MSSLITPYGINSFLNNNLLLTNIETVVTNTGEVKTYSKTLSKGGYIIITGLDGCLLNDLGNDYYENYNSEITKYQTGINNAFILTSLTLDGINIPLTDSYNSGWFQDIKVAAGFMDCTLNQISGWDPLGETSYDRTQRIIYKYEFPIYQTISLNYKINTSGTGVFCFYTYEYEN